MKNNKRILSLCMVWIMLVVSLVGCGKLAKEEGALSDVTGDKLIGGYVTTQALEEKVYGELAVTMKDGHEFVEYVFKGIEGVNFTLPDVEDKYTVVMFGEESSERKYSVNIVDDIPKDIKIEGTVFYPKDVTFYLNSVYQESDGDVYMVPDTVGYYVTKTEGSYGLSTKDTYTETDNGKSIERTMEVNVKFEYKPQTEDIRIVYMDNNDCIISTEEYSKDDIPDKINIDKNVQYIIMESNGTEGQRELYDRDDNVFLTYHKAKGDICVGKECELIWE